MKNAFVEQILADPPKLHFWGDEWRIGGFSSDYARKILEWLEDAAPMRDLRIVETGAGLSSALFVGAGARRVVSIAPSADLLDRVGAYLAENAIDASGWEPIAARSEEALPKLAEADAGGFDVALIDGGHGWPTVFVDMCYMHRMLRQGGLLLLDDLHLYSVHECFRWLQATPQMELLEQHLKLAVFRKVWREDYFPDFGGQPYIKDGQAKVPPLVKKRHKEPIRRD